MSLLFDALKRAQGDAAQPAPDASQHTDRQTAAPTEVKALHPANQGLKSGIRPYAIAVLMLLTAVTAWFIFQYNRSPAISSQHPAPAIAAIEPASGPQAPSDIAQTSKQLNTLPATASGTETSANKAWTHPLTAKKQQQRKTTRKSAGKSAAPGIRNSAAPLKEGYLALSQGHLDLSEQYYLEVLAQRPHEKDALLGLAVVAQRKQQTERAAELYRQVLHEDIGNTTAAAGLVSLSAQADPVAAESQLRELLDIRPAAPELHYALGNILASQLRWGEAQLAFFRAYSLRPANALYAYNLAVALDHLHQPAAALPYYEKTMHLAKDPALDQDAIVRRIHELNGSR